MKYRITIYDEETHIKTTHYIEASNRTAAKEIAWAVFADADDIWIEEVKYDGC